METEYYLYKTCKNDRWDLIATKFYGNCYQIKSIIEANIHVAITSVLEDGIEIRVPKIKETNISTLIWKKE